MAEGVEGVEGMPAPLPLRDSDLVCIAAQRMQRVADKMLRLEYDAELDRQLAEVSEILEYLAGVIAARRGGV